jgi:oligosaccharyltransferase complex subunit gamma
MISWDGTADIVCSKVSGTEAEQFRRYLLSNIQVPDFPLIKPFNWNRLLGTIAFLLVAGTVTKLAWAQIKKIVSNRNFWAVGSLVTILLFTSGHMFSSIRHTPFVQANGKGGIAYIAGGFQNQFGIETQIVASICKCSVGLTNGRWTLGFYNNGTPH